VWHGKEFFECLCSSSLFFSSPPLFSSDLCGTFRNNNMIPEAFQCYVWRQLAPNDYSLSYHYALVNVPFLPVWFYWNRTETWVCGSSLVGVTGSNPSGETCMSVTGEFCVWSGIDLCVGPITRPGESYRVRCVCCDQETSTMRKTIPTTSVEPWKNCT